MKSVLKNKTDTKTDTEKFITNGSKPASFQAFIKDHKDNSDGFLLRPIAPVQNTVTEKVDRLISGWLDTRHKSCDTFLLDQSDDQLDDRTSSQTLKLASD